MFGEPLPPIRPVAFEEPRRYSRSDKSFLTDIRVLHKRASRHMDQGAVTGGYQADREAVLKILNTVLATESVCVLRYKRHYYMASGINAQSVADEEQDHADRITQRITRLGGEPDFNPQGLATRSHSGYLRWARICLT